MSHFCHDKANRHAHGQSRANNGKTNKCFMLKHHRTDTRANTRKRQNICVRVLSSSSFLSAYLRFNSTETNLLSKKRTFEKCSCIFYQNSTRFKGHSLTRRSSPSPPTKCYSPGHFHYAFVCVCHTLGLSIELASWSNGHPSTRAGHPPFSLLPSIFHPSHHPLGFVPQPNQLYADSDTNTETRSESV